MRSVAALLLVAAPLVSLGEPLRRANHPALSPDGSQLAFSWQGDLWIVPADGGEAKRLTVHPAQDVRPIWNPDGKSLVFASNRYGNPDVFKIAVDGTGLRRLTFDSGSELPVQVLPDGTIIGTGVLGGTNLFKLSPGGGEAVRLTEFVREGSFHPSITPDGKQIVYVKGSYGQTLWMKPGVTGSGMGDLFIADYTVPLTNHRVIARTDASECFPMVAPDRSLYVISNRSGWPNLWKMKLDGSGAKKLTDHSFGTMRNPSLSADGSKIAYDFESDLYVYDVARGTSTKVEIDVPRDARTNPNAEIALTTGIASYAVAPDSKRMVIGLRGDLFLIPEKGGTTRRLTKSIRMDGSPVFLDAKTFLYVAAGEGAKREIRKMTIEGEDSALLSDPKLDLIHPVVSPDGKKLAFHRGGTEVVVCSVDGTNQRVFATSNYQFQYESAPAFSWSPDNAFLAIATPTDRGTNVSLFPADGGTPTLVARLPKGINTEPRFLPNGKGVYFIAEDITNTEAFVVDLVPVEPTFSEDDLDKIDAPKPPKSEVKVEVVREGIEQRLRRLTADGANDILAAADSKSFYVTKGDVVVSIPYAGGRATPVAAINGNAAALGWGPGLQKLYFASSGKLFSWSPDKPAASPIAFDAQYTLNLRDEEKALFEEIGWAFDRQYYDDRFHGKDWAALRAKFAALIPHAQDRTDFYNMVEEMLEELDSSHLGATPPPAETFGNDSTALLGVEWDPKALNQRFAYVVSRVIPGSAASMPVSKLEKGDRVLKVDGVEPTSEQPMAALLNRKAGKKVRLSVDRAGKTFEIEIKPDSPAARSNLEYEAWVAWQRDLVDRLSDGKLAYVHIRGMNQPSHERFLREIRMFTPGKKGLIVDVRYNGGGSTAHQALGVLIKTPWLVRTTRGPEGIKLSENIFRGDSVEIPSGLMANSFSFSNAEIMSEGFRRLIKGPIVGERTPGYVIGTGGYGLWDGGFIRMPVIGSYTIDGEELENNGRRPDYEVWFDPNAAMEGRDPQLEKMVAELLKRI